MFFYLNSRFTILSLFFIHFFAYDKNSSAALRLSQFTNKNTPSGEILSKIASTCYDLIHLISNNLCFISLKRRYNSRPRTCYKFKFILWKLLINFLYYINIITYDFTRSVNIVERWVIILRCYIDCFSLRASFRRLSLCFGSRTSTSYSC